MYVTRIAIVTLLCLLQMPSVPAADPDTNNWREFRNGGTSTTQARLPISWQADSITWQRELAGYGQSTPVIAGGRVYVTSVVGPMKDECVISCLDLRSGQELWQFKHAASELAASNYMAARAAPTPMVDAQGVYAFFESGDCLAVDLSGKLRWHRSLTADYGKFDNNHGLGASPTQTDQLVIINVEHRGPSYLIALQKANGSTHWKVERSSSSSWSSPVVIKAKDRSQIIVSSGGTVAGYDVASGQSQWSLGGLDGNSVPSPTPAGERLLVGARVPEFGGDGEAARSNLCIDLNVPASGAEAPKVAWRASKAVSDYASPVLCGDYVYYLNKVGVLHCLNASSGESHYMERLGTQCWATPIVADDRIYFFGKDGKTQVVRAGAKFELIHSNLLWDPTSPPKPESYVENNERSSRATEGRGPSREGSGDENAASRGAARGPGGGRGAGMLAQLMKGDTNGDGRLTADEISAEFKPMLARVDTNGDGALDADELKAMAESFAARRADSQESARDPIVYGAAAVEGAIVIRTGTRLYCIQ